MMLKVEQNLNVSKEQFFDQLLYSLKTEIENETNKKVVLEDIKKGFTYKKELTNKTNNTGKVKVKIDELKRNELYKMRVITKGTSTIVEYRIEELEADYITVHYSENVENDTKAKNLNYKLLSWLYVRKGKRKIQSLLLAMENYILSTAETNL